jgi:hypothetical protein
MKLKRGVGLRRASLGETLADPRQVTNLEVIISLPLRIEAAPEGRPPLSRGEIDV